MMILPAPSCKRLFRWSSSSSSSPSSSSSSSYCLQRSQSTQVYVCVHFNTAHSHSRSCQIERLMRCACMRTCHCGSTAHILYTHLDVHAYGLMAGRGSYSSKYLSRAARVAFLSPDLPACTGDHAKQDSLGACATKDGHKDRET